MSETGKKLDLIQKIPNQVKVESHVKKEVQSSSKDVKIPKVKYENLRTKYII